MRAKYRKSTHNFTFYNRNPKNKVSSADCVPRAISLATGKSWGFIILELTEYGLGMGTVLNEKSTYSSWLQNNGWTKHKQPRKPNNKKYKLSEFVELYPKGMYIVSIANHLTCVEDGMIYDTWNCSHKTVGNFWSLNN